MRQSFGTTIAAAIGCGDFFLMECAISLIYLAIL